MYERTIICLAKSRKTDGLCIAGKELDGERAGQWVRPVSSRSDGEVTEEECQYETGDSAQLLDIVTVQLNMHAPLRHQTENHVFAEDYFWVKDGSATQNQVSALIDPFDANFWVNANSTRYGINDKVPENVATGINSSLKLVTPTNLQMHVAMEAGYQGSPSRKRVRAQFEYHNQTYKLSVTDVEIENHYLTHAVGIYPIVNATLCISLVEPWNGYAFRVVASVITPDRFGG